MKLNIEQLTELNTILERFEDHGFRCILSNGHIDAEVRTYLPAIEKHMTFQLGGYGNVDRIYKDYDTFHRAICDYLNKESMNNYKVTGEAKIIVSTLVQADSKDEAMEKARHMKDWEWEEETHIPLEVTSVEDAKEI